MIITKNNVKLKISENGTIKNLDTGHILKGGQNSCGYYQISLKGKKYLRSHIIAEALIYNPNNFTEINHKDGDITNDSPNNLEWCTHSENQKNKIPGGKLRKIKLLMNNLNDDELLEIKQYLECI